MKTRRILYIFFLCLISFNISAQPTKIKGKVIDAKTGEPLPFVSIYFDNTTIGASTDLDGQYAISTNEATSNTLTASLVGYENQTQNVRLNSFNNIDFHLKESVEFINSIVVKPDNSYLNGILKKIYQNKDKNNPTKQTLYTCDSYSKMELDATNVNKLLNNKHIKKNYDFLKNYVDTSVVSGQSYLPIMISETVSKLYHREQPSLSREVITASKISGVGAEDASLTQFTGKMVARVNLYENHINLFNTQFIGPISNIGKTFYNYYLIDSLNIAGRKTYKIRFHPKSLTFPVFDGEINIDAKSYALESAHLKMMNGINVNWVRDLVLDASYTCLNDSTWFYKNENLYVDFSVSTIDTVRVLSFICKRQVDYSNPDFNTQIPREVEKIRNKISYKMDVLDKSEDYWQKNRPYPLSQKEQDIYQMVDTVKNMPISQNIYTVMNAIFGGYYEAKYIGFGPYNRLYSFNKLEGTRIQFGIQTTKNFHKKMMITAYGAYGFKDDALKYMGKVEYNFKRLPFTKLTAKYKKDVTQLGAGDPDDSSIGDFFHSLISNHSSDKLSIIEDSQIKFEREIANGVLITSKIQNMNVFSSEYVPLITPSGEMKGSINALTFSLGARIAFNETVTRSRYNYYPIYTKYPIINITTTYGKTGIPDYSKTFYKINTSVKYNVKIPILGTSDFLFKAGKIFGKVPYPFLQLHEGNGTFVSDPYSFACMDFYEFASDEWITLFYEHNFKGLFLSKIPIIKSFNWRESIMFRSAYGTLSHKNDGRLLSSSSAILGFPKGMSELNKPYIELGVGINNILRVFRVDCFWRLNHLDRTNFPNRRAFTVDVGTELKF